MRLETGVTFSPQTGHLPTPSPKSAVDTIHTCPNVAPEGVSDRCWLCPLRDIAGG